MRSKKELCRGWKLYVITQPGADLEERVRRAVLGGADAVQLRDKQAGHEELARLAKKLRLVTQAHGVPFIVNDRVDVARAAGADGVHLGQEDGSLREAKQALGECALFGRSTHSSEQAFAAQKEGFDYIGVGPVFETPTKAGRPAVGLELVRFAAKNLDIPFVAIGGIDAGNAPEVRKAGASAVAVVRAVMAAADPRAAAHDIRRFF